ncbi:MAG: hypothetical protein DDT34_02495 [Firmicutes bacterium]|nr:hypothetical protein [Bacillota bacterium]
MNSATGGIVGCNWQHESLTSSEGDLGVHREARVHVDEAEVVVIDTNFQKVTEPTYYTYPAVGARDLCVRQR